MHRGERFGWILVGLITIVLTLMAASIVVYGYWGDRRVAECRDGEMPGSDRWDDCSSAGNFNG